MPPAVPEALRLLETRRTVSWFQLAEPGPSDEEIRRIVAVAARVPDHGKLTPWRFVLWRGAARAAVQEKLTPIYRARHASPSPEKAKLEESRFTAVPLTIGVISTAREHFKIPLWEQELSAGAACMNLMLAAHALGYSAQWLTGWCCYDDEAAAILGAKPGERLAGLIAIGTPTVPPVERPRPAHDDIVTDWTE